VLTERTFSVASLVNSSCRSSIMSHHLNRLLRASSTLLNKSVFE